MAEKVMARIHLGKLISFLRWLFGWSQEMLGRKSGLDKKQIGRYEAGQAPEPANWEKITTAFGIPPKSYDLIRWCLRLIHKAIRAGRPVRLPAPRLENRRATRVAVWQIVDRALSLAYAELALLRCGPAPEAPTLPTAEDLQRVEGLWARLKGYSEAQQRLLVEGARSYQDWLLCVRLCTESEKAATQQPSEALKLADLALFLAHHVPGTEAWRARLKGFCTAFLANAQRLTMALKLADTTFAKAWRLWRSGRDELQLLSEAAILDLEASLRRDQRNLSLALRRHAEALRVARSEERGSILLNQSDTFLEKGDHGSALQSLAEALEVIDGERQPRLRFGVRFNQAANLIRLGRAQEAEPLVREARELAERLGNTIDLLKTDWLRGNLLAALGRRNETVAALEPVRRAFEQQSLPYDFALASLDLALVYREQGRFADIAELAAEILTIFEAQGVQREAIASVLLFREAAEKQEITAAAVRRLAEDLQRVRRTAKRRTAV